MNEQLSRGSNLNLPRGSYQSLLCRVNIPLMETTQQGAWWVRKAANAILQTVLSHPRDSERPPGRKRRRTFQLWDTRPLLRRPAAGRAVARQHLWVGCTPPSGQRDLPSKQEQAAGSKPLPLNYGGASITNVPTALHTGTVAPGEAVLVETLGGAAQEEPPRSLRERSASRLHHHRTGDRHPGEGCCPAALSVCDRTLRHTEPTLRAPLGSPALPLPSRAHTGEPLPRSGRSFLRTC